MLNAPFLNSGKLWFESTPEPIAHLFVVLPGFDKPLPVTRFNDEGAFILAARDIAHANPLTFQFKNHTLSCHVYFICSESYGFGVQFTQMSLDQKKELCDFIEIINGEGHETI